MTLANEPAADSSLNDYPTAPLVLPRVDAAMERAVVRADMLSLVSEGIDRWLADRSQHLELGRRMR